jgi:outer membrane murein-binding lipoprotein Lpp
MEKLGEHMIHREIRLPVAIVLAGCTQYIKRDKFDSTVSDLRSSDENLQGAAQRHDRSVLRTDRAVKSQV